MRFFCAVYKWFNFLIYWHIACFIPRYSNDINDWISFKVYIPQCFAMYHYYQCCRQLNPFSFKWYTFNPIIFFYWSLKIDNFLALCLHIQMVRLKYNSRCLKWRQRKEQNFKSYLLDLSTFQTSDSHSSNDAVNRQEQARKLLEAKRKRQEEIQRQKQEEKIRKMREEQERRNKEALLKEQVRCKTRTS